MCEYASQFCELVLLLSSSGLVLAALLLSVRIMTIVPFVFYMVGLGFLWSRPSMFHAAAFTSSASPINTLAFCCKKAVSPPLLSFFPSVLIVLLQRAGAPWALAAWGGSNARPGAQEELDFPTVRWGERSGRTCVPRDVLLVSVATWSKFLMSGDLVVDGKHRLVAI